MQNGFFNTAHPGTKLFLVLFLMITCYLILFGLGLLVAIPIFNVSVKDVISIIENNSFENNLPLIRMMQVFYSTGLFLLPAILAAFLISRRAGKYLSLYTISGVDTILLVILLMFSIIPLINFAGYLNEEIVRLEVWNGLMDKVIANDETQWQMMEAFLDAENIGVLLFNLFMIAFIPALAEEMLFRGVLQRIFGEWFRNHHIAIWVVAILFSLAHYQLSGFIPRIFLGALFGYLYLWTSSIWIPVIAHFTNNGMAVIYYYFFYRGSLARDPDQIGIEGNMLIFILVSTFISAILILTIQRLGKKSANTKLLGVE
jgi:uncharacterized protein